MHRFLVTFGMVTGILFSGCQTAKHQKPFVAHGTLSGKLIWKTSSRTVAADVIIQYGENNATRLTLVKQGGTPLLIITRMSNFLEVDDLYGKRHWKGEPSRPPETLIGWAALLEAVSATPHMPEGMNEVHNASGWEAIYNIQNGKLKNLDLISDLSHEHYQLSF